MNLLFNFSTIMNENPQESPKLTTQEEVVALMKSSKSEQEWNDNCDKVKADFNGYPNFWHTAIMMSNITQKTTNSFGSNADIRISTIRKNIGDIID